MEAKTNGLEVEDEENAPLLTDTPVKPVKVVVAKEGKKGKSGEKKKWKDGILVVGSTGSGKTSLINIYTGSDLVVGHSAESQTTMAVTVKDRKHPGRSVWVDNPGWSDTTGRPDSEVFKKLLQHLVDEGIQSLKAVIWCVNPNSKMDIVLQAQARLIDMFTVEGDKGKIWSNVLILCKGALKDTSEEDCIGAVMAARKVYAQANPRTLGYAFARPQAIDTMTTEQRVGMRMLTEAEILEKLEEEMEMFPTGIQVVFVNKRCRDCGQEGDPRLMEDTCHKKKVRGHTGELRLKKKHSKPKIGAAYAVGTVGVVGLGVAAVMVPGSELVLLGVPMVMSPGTVMSLRRVFTDGDWKYRCCERGEKEEGGCTDLCEKCRAVWGTKPPGCIMIRHPDRGLQESMDNYEFEKKEHDLEDI